MWCGNAVIAAFVVFGCTAPLVGGACRLPQSVSARCAVSNVLQAGVLSCTANLWTSAITACGGGYGGLDEFQAEDC